MKKVLRYNNWLLLLLFPLLTVQAMPQKLPDIASKTAGFKKYMGFYTFYWDEAGGKVWLEIDKFNQDFLYVNSLPGGLGSNDIGLDRG
ncbi:DUF5118 domain-containing protein [Pontibacter arcticus]|uniref:DUF5118 domain-containing protein n=1 Tax=Pontibacter arcticus TaxID=2080288 RepID=UPI001EEFD486|nr:DUF5118 domain-containing protein [Pontibacter arcticus]